MQMQNVHREWVGQLVAGDVSWHALPAEWSESERMAVRQAALEQISGESFGAISNEAVVEAAAGRNCEQMIGMVGVPLGVVGPMKLSGEGEVLVPLATSEGALVASVQRGVKALNLGQVTDWVEDRGMTRAPVFEVKNLEAAREMIGWLESDEGSMQMAEVAEKTSRHLHFIGVKPRVVGKNLYVKFSFDTGAAMGMNMATIATEALVEYLESRFAQSRCVALSGNGCVDKKPAWGSVLEGRGMWAQAEAVIPEKIVREVLKTDSARVVEVVMRKNLIGGAVSGAMGFNAHMANMVAAFYLATGQDMAHVVEGSLGLTTAEVVDEGLYVSVTMPNVLMGVIGGGTGLPYQRRNLAMMGVSEVSSEAKLRLGRILARVVLAGELSLLAALASGSLARAHAKLGRKRA